MATCTCTDHGNMNTTATGSAKRARRASVSANTVRKISLPIAIFSFISLVALVLLYLPASVVAIDSVSDRSALVSVFESMGGAQWTTRTSWLSPTISMCLWYGVTCQAGCPTNSASIECRVVDLYLDSNRLRGAIAPRLANLTQILSLALGNNQLTGTVPSFPTLTQLQQLGLNNNQLTGVIPEFEALTQLQYLDLSANQLSGILPQFSTLTNLRFLFLYSNRLTGSIPQLATLTQLRQLAIFSNQLIGSIPEFTALAQLQYLDLSRNQLSGILPQFSSLTKLQFLYLYSNKLSGTIPQFATLRLLQYMLFSSNQLSGTIPQFSTLVQLLDLRLDSNQLSGTVPEFRTLVRLQRLHLDGNLLTGTLSQLTNLTRLQFLYLNANQLSGTIPQFATLRLLQYLHLSRNQLSGTVPQFSNLVQLLDLRLDSNQLSGTVPEFSTLVRLQWLYLNDNMLAGTISQLTNLTSLRFLHLHANQFTGTIPQFASLGLLQYLYLHANQLSGTIPQFSNLVQLLDLRLNSNQLSGSAPQFAFLTKLQFLDLSSNQLSDTMPGFTNLTKLQRLFMSNNQISGTIPGFASSTQLQVLDLSNNQLTGTIPQFATLSQLRQLLLQSNQLDGTIPEFNAITQLQSVGLNDNKLSGTIPQFATLVQLRELSVTVNQLTGTIPTFATSAQLQILGLNSNQLTGTVPSRFPSQLMTLALSNNSLSGTVPTFENNTMLQQLYIDCNSMSGTLPSLDTLLQLRELSMSCNKLTGTLPASWRSLRFLSLLDVSQNSLSGEIRMFQTDARFPPLSVSTLNLSSNQFGGAFTELPPIETLNLTTIDIRKNEFICPYPLFSLSLRVLRSACVTDWTELGVNMGICFSVVVVGIIVFLVARQVVMKQSLGLALCSAGILSVAASLVSDSYSYMVMINYLQTRSRNCNLMNEFHVFSPQIQVVASGVPIALQNVSGNYEFSNWISPLLWDQISIRIYSDRFDSVCRRAPECAYDDALKRCYESRPDLATSGGAAHQAFLHAVWVFVSIRIVYELFCFVLIVVSCVRRSLLMGFRIFMIGSVWFPLLLISKNTRESMLTFIVADRKPKHYILQLCTSGLFITGFKLFADAYYLLKVAQNGFGWSNWLSLLLGLVLVPKLIGQAAWAWWKTRHDAPDSWSTFDSEPTDNTETTATDSTSTATEESEIARSEHGNGLKQGRQGDSPHLALALPYSDLDAIPASGNSIEAVGNSQNTLHIGASAVDTDSSAVEMQAVSIPETDHKAVSSNASSISAAEPIIELRRHEQKMTVDSDNICEATHGRDESPQHSNSAIAFSTISVVHTISSSSNSKPVGDAEVLEFSSHDEVPVAVNSGSLAADANNENCHDPTIAHSNAEFNIFPASGPIPAADDEIFEADSSN